MKSTIQSAVTRSCFSPAYGLARGVFPGSAAGVFGKSSGRMKTSNISNLSDDLGGNHRAAAGSSQERLLVVFHYRCQLFLNLLNFLPQIKETAQRSLHPLLQYGICVF